MATKQIKISHHRIDINHAGVAGMELISRFQICLNPWSIKVDSFCTGRSQLDVKSLPTAALFCLGWIKNFPLMAFFQGNSDVRGETLLPCFSLSMAFPISMVDLWFTVYTFFFFSIEIVRWKFFMLEWCNHVSGVSFI